MDKRFLELAKQATEEGWDAFRIMSEMIQYQKEKDAKIVLDAGYEDLSNKILLQ